MSCRFLADENFNARIVSGVRRAVSDIDLVTVQEAGLRTMADADLLAWAATEGRMILTHDVNTMIGFAQDRARAGLPMGGLIVVREDASTGDVIRDFALVAECVLPGELEGQVLYLPW